jgi:glycosyltransferase involved in cell wall biosynthesis
MKVLHLSSERGWRGGEQQIAYLVDELKDRGVDVYLAVRRNSEFEKYCQQKNIPHKSLPFRNAADFKTAWAIRKLCQEFNPDLLHMHSSVSHGIGVLSALLGNSVPLVLSRRVDFVPKNKWITKFKYNHSSVKRILCVSEKINEIIRAYIRKPEKSITVHSGIDTNKFNVPRTENLLRKEYAIPSDIFLVGNTSALEGHKDYYTFLNTIAILAELKMPVRAFIIGAGSLEYDLKQYARSKKLDEYVIFTGFRKDILLVLPCLDLFLITSNEEGLGTSVLDAFAAGVPVVGTAAGGIPEMVIHRQTGLLAPIGNSRILAEAAMEIISDRTLRENLLRNAREKLKEFSKEKTAQKTLAVYREVMLEFARA